MCICSHAVGTHCEAGVAKALVILGVDVAGVGNNNLVWLTARAPGSIAEAVLSVGVSQHLVAAKHTLRARPKQHVGEDIVLKSLNHLLRCNSEQ